MTPAITATGAASLTLSQRLAAGFFAFALGLLLLGGIGLAHDMRVHNGAHDARHALGFPCH